MSIALVDRELQRSLEPGTASPQARLELVRKIVEAGLPCGVFVAPVLPGLTDSVEQLDALLAAIADTGATGVTVLPLHLRPGAREWFAAWLAREHPRLVPAYRQIYAKGSNADLRYRRWLGTRVGPLLRRHGLDKRETRRSRGTTLAGRQPDRGHAEGGTGKAGTTGTALTLMPATPQSHKGKAAARADASAAKRSASVARPVPAHAERAGTEVERHRVRLPVGRDLDLAPVHGLLFRVDRVQLAVRRQRSGSNCSSTTNSRTGVVNRRQ